MTAVRKACIKPTYHSTLRTICVPIVYRCLHREEHRKSLSRHNIHRFTEISALCDACASQKLVNDPPANILPPADARADKDDTCIGNQYKYSAGSMASTQYKNSQPSQQFPRKKLCSDTAISIHECCHNCIATEDWKLAKHYQLHSSSRTTVVQQQHNTHESTVQQQCSNYSCGLYFTKK